jgi:preprotein translocase subunit SecF
MDIVGKRKWFFIVTAVLILICIISLATVGLKTGVEFSSGSMLTVGFENEIAADELKEYLASTEHSSALIQRMGTGDFIIRTMELDEAAKDQLMAGLESEFGAVELKEFNNVTPMVASETARNAAIAVLVAAVAMLLYIAWAFRRMPNPFRFGICAIAGLAMDTILALGVFSILGNVMVLEINLMFITGVLAVIGYSINNTVVVFDRVRENITRGVHADFSDIVNTSIVQTLSRSVNTSLTTLITLLALILFVGASIQNFVIVLIIGVVSGLFSSTCIAPTLLVEWHKRSGRKSVGRSSSVEVRARS